MSITKPNANETKSKMRARAEKLIILWNSCSQHSWHRHRTDFSASLLFLIRLFYSFNMQCFLYASCAHSISFLYWFWFAICNSAWCPQKKTILLILFAVACSFFVNSIMLRPNVYYTRIIDRMDCEESAWTLLISTRKNITKPSCGNALLCPCPIYKLAASGTMLKTIIFRLTMARPISFLL